MFLFLRLFALFCGFFGQLPFLFAAFWIKKVIHVLHFGAKISRLHAVFAHFEAKISKLDRAVFAHFWTLMA